MSLQLYNGFHKELRVNLIDVALMRCFVVVFSPKDNVSVAALKEYTSALAHPTTGIPCQVSSQYYSAGQLLITVTAVIVCSYRLA